MEFSFLSDQSPVLQEVRIPPTETRSKLERGEGGKKVDNERKRTNVWRLEERSEKSAACLDSDSESSLLNAVSCTFVQDNDDVGRCSQADRNSYLVFRYVV